MALALPKRQRAPTPPSPSSTDLAPPPRPVADAAPATLDQSVPPSPASNRPACSTRGQSLASRASSRTATTSPTIGNAVAGPSSLPDGPTDGDGDAPLTKTRLRAVKKKRKVGADDGTPAASAEGSEVGDSGAGAGAGAGAQGGNGTEAPVVPKKKRTQVKSACKACQKSRRKCSGDQPCDSCFDKKIACEWSEAKTRDRSTKRGPYTKKKKPPNEELLVPPPDSVPPDPTSELFSLDPSSAAALVSILSDPALSGANPAPDADGTFSSLQGPSHFDFGPPSGGTDVPTGGEDDLFALDGMGMDDDLKAHIQGLVDQMLLEELAAQAESSDSLFPTNGDGPSAATSSWLGGPDGQADNSLFAAHLFGPGVTEGDAGSQQGELNGVAVDDAYVSGRGTDAADYYGIEDGTERDDDLSDQQQPHHDF